MCVSNCTVNCEVCRTYTWVCFCPYLCYVYATANTPVWYVSVCKQYYNYCSVNPFIVFVLFIGRQKWHLAVVVVIVQQLFSYRQFEEVCNLGRVVHRDTVSCVRWLWQLNRCSMECGATPLCGQTSDMSLVMWALYSIWSIKRAVITVPWKLILGTQPDLK